jgi:hypothetical protein
MLLLMLLMMMILCVADDGMTLESGIEVHGVPQGLRHLT